LKPALSDIAVFAASMRSISLVLDLVRRGLPRPFAEVALCKILHNRWQAQTQLLGHFSFDLTSTLRGLEDIGGAILDLPSVYFKRDTHNM
jgi:hypothetical protein